MNDHQKNLDTEQYAKASDLAELEKRFTDRIAIIQSNFDTLRRRDRHLFYCVLAIAAILLFMQ